MRHSGTIVRYAAGWLAAAGILTGSPLTDAAVRTWNNTGTDFNAGSSWTGGAPGSGDIATFSGAPGTQPNVTANISIDGLDFSTTDASGYVLSSTGGVLELLSTSTSVGAAAITGRNTSGTNTISADLHLGAGSDQTFRQAEGGTLVLSGAISGNTGIHVLTATGGNVVRLTNPNNSFTGGVTIGGNSNGALETTAFGMADGSNSPLGTATTINLGTSGSGVIRYIGAGETTDKIINLSGTTTGAEIHAPGGNLRITGDLAFTGAVAKTLTLQGGTSSDPNEFAGDITDGTGGGTVRISIAAASTWTLSGNNTYSGGTGVTSGSRININSATALGTGDVSVPASGVAFSIDNTSGSPITLVNNNNWVTSGFTFAGSNDLNLGTGTHTLFNGGNRTITVSASTLTIGGEVRESGGVVLLIKSGDGHLVLGGNNTYTGGTNVNAGTLTLSGNNVAATGLTTLGAARLNLNSDGALGGNLTINNANAVLGNTSGTAVTLAYNPVQNWNTNFEFAGPYDLNLGTGTATINANRAVTVTAGTLTVGGEIAQSGSNRILTKNGSGTLVLNGDNTYTGATIVNGGTLLINGGATVGTNASNVTVNDGGTLGGSGIIRGTVTVNDGGSLAPGNSPGVLTIAGLTLAGGANFVVDLFGTTPGSQYDQLIVTANNIVLGSANLVLNITGPLNKFNYGDVLTLIDNTGSGSISGMFLGLNDGDFIYVSGNRFAAITYQSGPGGDVLLTILPEPASAAALLSLGLCLFRRRMAR